jgi:hypothetical protein
MQWREPKNLTSLRCRQTDKADPTDPMPRRQAHGLGNDLVRRLPVGVDAQFRRGVALGEGGEARRQAREIRRFAIPGRRLAPARCPVAPRRAGATTRSLRLVRCPCIRPRRQFPGMEKSRRGRGSAPAASVSPVSAPVRASRCSWAWPMSGALGEACGFAIGSTLRPGLWSAIPSGRGSYYRR